MRQKSKENTKLKPANFEAGAVQKHIDLVDLFKCCRMRLDCNVRLQYSRERTFQVWVTHSSPTYPHPLPWVKWTGVASQYDVGRNRSTYTLLLPVILGSTRVEKGPSQSSRHVCPSPTWEGRSTIGSCSRLDVPQSQELASTTKTDASRHALAPNPQPRRL